jgi:DNA (cytosine-5)-methyltransferase 1
MKRTETERQPPALCAVDLFSGIGGLSLGLARAGFTVVGAVERDALAAAAYAVNHPRTRLVQLDIRCLTPRRFMSILGFRKGDLDLLAGCPPCQGFSSLRTLKGSRKIVDDRNDLVDNFGDFIEALFPRTILMENVPGLVSDRRLFALIKRLKKIGYADLTVGVLDAADYGVPQRRRRMLFMASRIGPVTFPAPVRRRRTVRETIGDLPLPGRSGDPAHDRTCHHSEKVQELIRDIPSDGGSRADLGEDRQLSCHKRTHGFHDIYGRMAWDDVAPTITTGCINPSKGRFLHPEQNRAITVREAALLQTFPRNYVVPMTRGLNPAATLIGNAFPPEFAKRQAIQLRALLAGSV